MFTNLWHGVWADNTFPGKAIVAIILFLLFRSFTASLRHFSRYRRESGSLARVIARLKAERETQPKAPDFPTAASSGKAAEATASPEGGLPQLAVPVLVDLGVLKEGLDPSTLIFERLAAIEKLRARQVKVNLQTLQQLSLARDEARPGLAIPGFAASMSIMLGLLGTFIGLVSMVQGIQFALPGEVGHVTVESWTHSLQNVFSVLSGIKTAFSSSLTGMVCAVFSTLLNFRLRATQATFFEKLERFTTEDLLPATVPAVEDESLLEQVSLQLESSFGQLETIYRQNQGALKDLTAAQQAFVGIVAEIRQITRSEASRNLDRVIEQLGQTNRAVTAVVEHLPKISGAIEAGQRRLFDRLAEQFGSLRLGGFAPEPRKATSSPSLVVVLAVLGVVLVLAVVKSGFWR